jgi:preprotein translocase subunit SecG
MLILVINVIYVLLAIAMIALILMQRGSGAQAGAGFGGGASATVFGSRGASSFLSKSTKWLAIVFFTTSMAMAWYATHKAAPQGPVQADLGVMAQQVPAAPAGNGNSTVPAAPQAPASTAPASTVPAAPATTGATAPQEQAPSGN